jgi:hypothetical protein
MITYEYVPLGRENVAVGPAELWNQLHPRLEFVTWISHVVPLGIPACSNVIEYVKV